MGQIRSRIAFTGMRVTATSLRISGSRSSLNRSGSLSFSFSFLLLRVIPALQSSALLNVRYYFRVLLLSFFSHTIDCAGKKNESHGIIHYFCSYTRKSIFFFFLECDELIEYSGVYRKFSLHPIGVTFEFAKSSYRGKCTWKRTLKGLREEYQ